MFGAHLAVLGLAAFVNHPDRLDGNSFTGPIINVPTHCVFGASDLPVIAYFYPAPVVLGIEHLVKLKLNCSEASKILLAKGLADHGSSHRSSHADDGNDDGSNRN